MPPITPLKLGLTLGILLLAFSGGFELRVLIDHSNERDQLKAQAVAQAAAQKKADDAAQGWVDQLSKLRLANKAMKGRLQNEVSKPVYAACVVPSDGVQLYNDAIR